ncbi:MAG: flagellar biosynthesis protein FlhA [Alteromonadaceae bacterium]|nr:MAG: flagellar biosynthesis protein FlhA [Alteromonadaceae bacterium]
MNNIRNMFTGIHDLLLAAGMISILMILFIPIPPSVLDFLLLLNFSVALLILLVTFYTEKPTAFSTFPSLLLMTTLFRLSLNISATRLILDEADAGKVIDAVGHQVVGGNYVIGLVVFLILIVVQYVVVTNGAQRVAEVAARFILDSLPGKQMSIDADLNMGIIDQDEAKSRRSGLEKESNFYGAMDGASKFVKGDAIAGIIIVIIDIIGGLIIGMVQRGMSWGEALHRYTLLTVGDGIVTQVPSLIIAVATGIIITRAATDTRLAQEITMQFSSHPKTLIIVAVALSGLALVPGIPAIPALAIVVLLGTAAYFSYKQKKTGTSDSDSAENGGTQTEQTSEEDALYQLIKSQAFTLNLGSTLTKAYLDDPSEFEKRIGILRKQLAQQLGLILPALHASTEKTLDPNAYTVQINGIEMGNGNINPDHLLAINPGGERATLEGEKTREPTYGLPAQWIKPTLRSQAQAAGYTLVEAQTVLMTHIQELCKRNASEFLTRAETEKLIESRRDDLGSLIDELIPAVLSYSDIQRVLQTLISEQVPIKNLDTILEVLVDLGRQIKEPENLAERVREKLSIAICKALDDKQGRLSVMTLAPNLEQKILSAATNTESKHIGLAPHELEQFISKAAKECEKMLGANLNPVLLCAPQLRKIIRNMLIRVCPQLHVLSTNEVSRHPNIVSAGLIEVEMQT